MVEFKRIQLEKGIRLVGPNRWEVQVHIGRDPATSKLDRSAERPARESMMPYASELALSPRLLRQIQWPRATPTSLIDSTSTPCIPAETAPSTFSTESSKKSTSDSRTPIRSATSENDLGSGFRTPSSDET